MSTGSRNAGTSTASRLDTLGAQRNYKSWFIDPLSDVLFVIGLAVFAVSGSVAVTAALFILIFVQT